MVCKKSLEVYHQTLYLSNLQTRLYGLSITYSCYGITKSISNPPPQRDCQDKHTFLGGDYEEPIIPPSIYTYKTFKPFLWFFK